MKASVCIITHNHQRWLADAIDSALMQETEFDFEIVVGVDTSDDRTLEIAQQYAKHHDKIKVAHSHKRLGGKHNMARTINLAKGKYIAHMDGDDFWTCPHKLQDQVDFLENNPEYSGSVTQAAIEYHGHLDTRFEDNYARTQESWEGSEVVKTPSFAASSSLVYCKKDMRPLPRWFFDLAWGDSAMRGILAAQGKFHYLQRKCVTYRCNNWGALQTLREKGKRHMARAAKDIQAHIQAYHKEFITA